jgi:hypothetical protein
MTGAFHRFQTVFSSTTDITQSTGSFGPSIRKGLPVFGLAAKPFSASGPNQG